MERVFVDACRNVDLPSDLSKAFLTKCIDEHCLSAKRAFHLVRTRALNKATCPGYLQRLVSCKGPCQWQGALSVVFACVFAVLWTVVKGLLAVAGQAEVIHPDRRIFVETF